MLESDFHSEFQGSIDRGDISSANDTLMRELGRILVRNRTDFVHLLNESGISATADMSDAKLVNLFIDNVGENKSLTLGASLLVNMHNRQMGFDGEDEVSDLGVKNGFAVMQEYFSNVGGAWGEAIGKVADLGSKGLEGHQKKKYGVQDTLLGKHQAKSEMSKQVVAQRESQIQATREKQAAQSKTNRTILIVGGIVVGLAIVAGVIYQIKKRGK